MFGLGMGELMVFSLVGLLLFGTRLPGTMKSLGGSIRAFREGISEGEKLLP